LPRENFVRCISNALNPDDILPPLRIVLEWLGCCENRWWMLNTYSFYWENMYWFTSYTHLTFIMRAHTHTHRYYTRRWYVMRVLWALGHKP
jgi:hypothetical protein